MQNSREMRRKYLVDAPVQSAILRQAACYWLLGSVIYTLVVTIIRIIPYCFTGRELTFGMVWYQVAPMAISSIVLLPVVMFGAVRFSHRFVGPMIRFRQVLKQLARGESVPPVVLRKNDFWFDVANELNEVSERFNEFNEKFAASTADHRESEAVGAG